MSAAAPDPKSFSSWEEAFQQPVPVVRSMERQLRREIESNKERLRSLVGASYRDLLKTAETIVEMDEQIHAVESHLSEIGQKCNPRLVEKKARNLRAWEKQVDSSKHARYAFASQMYVLRGCSEVISRLLSTPGESVLLAAKVLVISRLLHAKLSKRPQPPPYLETLRTRLATLRRKILSRIDRRFKSLGTTKEGLVEAMCAFALATSSAAADVARHFHHLRLEAIKHCMTSESRNPTLAALRLYLKTLQDTQEIVPEELTNALGSLKRNSLLCGVDISSQIELALDVHEKWLGDDIRSFTPYVRHDDLSKVEAGRLLKQWARTAIAKILQGLRSIIETIEDPMSLVKLRKEILDVWLSQRHHSTGVDPAETLDGFRDIFNDQSISMMDQQASKLPLVSQEVKRVVDKWENTVRNPSFPLWDRSMVTMKTAQGAQNFRTSLRDRLQGRDDHVRGVSRKYMEWLAGVAKFECAIQSLRDTKWEDEMADLDDEDDLDNVQVLLSKDDPRLLQQKLEQALHKAYSSLQQGLSDGSIDVSQPMAGHKSVFLIRTWREIRQQLPKSYEKQDLGLDSLKEFQTIVIDTALDSPLRSCSRRIGKNQKVRILATRQLWEGDPELPVLPSPWAYRLLSEVVESMTALGVDVWSPHLSNMLKRNLTRRLHDVLVSTITSKPVVNGHVNGEADDQKSQDEEAGDTQDDDRQGAIDGLASDANESSIAESTSHEKDAQTQQLFDVLYLAHACSSDVSESRDTEEEPRSLTVIQENLETDLALETKSLDRLRRAAEEYWTRTKLLFGLLG